MERHPFVYILASAFRGTTYVGVTSDLMRRLWEHRSGLKSRFPAKYSIYRLVYLEPYGDMEQAIRREKQLKNWHRAWKVSLIEAHNPHWSDLAVGLGFKPLVEKSRPTPKPSPRT
ncbi:MAG TPA: GIY-YIG nuclease family protein [Allosphingosinicella sp.]|jgi:putative endonuclease